MGAHNIKIVPDRKLHLLDQLQGLLEKQIELTRQGSVIDIERLSSQANSLVEKIAQEGILEQVEFENRRERLQKLYKDLHLALTANKADTAEKLDRIRKGKKLLAVYSRSLNNKS